MPMVVENVVGAQAWVGRAKWHYGSFYLWGDVPALMPFAPRGPLKRNPDGSDHGPGSWFAIADSKQRGIKTPGFRFDGHGRSFQSASVAATKGVPHAPTGHGTNPLENGIKQGGTWSHDPNSISRRSGSKSSARKEASALIAMIPFDLARWIGECYYPRNDEAVSVRTAKALCAEAL